MFACSAHGEQQTNEPESQTQIPPPPPPPRCLGLCSFLKSSIGVETKLLLGCVFVEQRGCLSARRPRPSGRWYNEDLHGYNLPHFNCKCRTQPTLWTSDGCAQNTTSRPRHFPLPSLAFLWISMIWERLKCRWNRHICAFDTHQTADSSVSWIQIFKSLFRPLSARDRSLDSEPRRLKAAISRNKVNEWVTCRVKGQLPFEGSKLPIYTHWPNLLALILTNA